MNNNELENKIKAIIAIENMFDMIIAAKNFNKEYKTSDFYMETKIPLTTIIEKAKIYYSFNMNNVAQKLQTIVNNLDLSKFDNWLTGFSETLDNDNNTTLEMLKNLNDLKNIVGK